MSADELWARKLKFLADTERELRRKLSQAERQLLAKIFERIIDKLTTEGGKVKATQDNLRVIDTLGKVFAEFATGDMLKITAQYAGAVMNNVKLSEAYFRTQAQGNARFDAIAKTATNYLRDRIGIKPDGNLKPSGYLSEIIEDVTVRREVRREMMRAIDEGGDLSSIRARVRKYLVPDKVEQTKPPGPVERQFARTAFDTLQNADRATNDAYAKELGLLAATWTGGLIETSRCLCQKLNAKTWTREELERIDKTNWDGKSGSIFINAGGHGCRHTPRWVGAAATLRKRPDLEMVDGKLTQRVGVEPQAFNKCEPRAPKRKAKR